MNLLICPSWYPQYEGDSHGSFFQEQAALLARGGYQVSVLILTGEAQKLKTPRYRWQRIVKFAFWRTRGPQLRRNEREGVEEVHLELPLAVEELYNFIDAPIPTMYLQAGIRKYLRSSIPPDLVHAHSALNGGFVARAVSLQVGVPFVVTEHLSSYQTGSLSASHLERARKVFERSSEVICVSRSLEASLQRCGVLNRRAKVVPNFVDCERFGPNFFKTESRKEVLCIAAGKPGKGLAVLVEAFGIALRQSEWVLSIVGKPGKETGRIEQLIRDNDLEGKVNLLGPKPREQVSSIIEEASFVVVSSTFETFGVTVIEALAMGKPVLSTRCGGPEEILDARNGLLVDSGSREAMAKGLSWMAEHHGEYDPEELRKDCCKRFGGPAVLLELGKVYESLTIG